MVSGTPDRRTVRKFKRGPRYPFHTTGRDEREEGRERVKRPSRHSIYMKMAHLAKLRSTCSKRQVGAVLVKGGRIIATGYNGSPSGMPHCIDEGCLIYEGHCVNTVHAEASVISMCSKYGIATDNTEMYVTTLPCGHCAKLLINAGVKKVYYDDEYESDLSKYFFKKAGVELYQIEEVLKDERV